MKYAIIVFILLVLYAILSNNMGGAREAAANYNKLLSNSPTSQGIKPSDKK